MRSPVKLPGPGEVHAWFTLTGAIRPTELLAAYSRLLSAQERDRLKRLRSEHSRRDYLIAHALLRTTLAGYLGQAPDDIAFTHNRFGKPRLAEPGPGLEFNLSHTRGFAVVAVAHGGVVGVDAENTDRVVDAISLQHVLAPAEIRQLEGWTPEQHRAAVFTFWTLKEAYVKARGEGLSIPLDSFAFRLGAGAQVPIAFTPAADDPCRDWFVAVFRPQDRYCVSVVAEQPAHIVMRLYVRETMVWVNFPAPWRTVPVA
jgi:4'-phosphopantetheinyl transferase